MHRSDQPDRLHPPHPVEPLNLDASSDVAVGVSALASSGVAAVDCLHADLDARSEQRHRRARFFVAAALLVSAACARPIPPADPQFVSEWMRHYYGLIRAERISPPVASRVLAYAAVALYEGLATASPGLASLAGQLNGLDSLPRPESTRRYDPILVALSTR